MRIAQVAPLYESVPPRHYGGTERVVSYLTEELVRRGHEVALFASGDSITSARLYPACERALRLQNGKVTDSLVYHVRMLEMVAVKAEDFDLVHYHIDYLHFPVTRRVPMTALTTLHGRLDIPELVPLYREFQDMHLTSISKAQRSALPGANWVGNVYHGLPPDLLKPQLNRDGKYLAFLGRICPEKRVDRAIEIARRAGLPLKIAAKVDPADQDYYESEIRRQLDDPLVEYVGEIGEHEKSEFLGNARALLFPIDWPEPFGLVLIESMACGTPVIAYEMGSVPEIIEDGVTGFLVHDVTQAVDAVQRLDSLDRRVCRRVFEERFSVQRMCINYERIYQHLDEGPTEEPRAIPDSTPATFTA
jgi:glycosyltransferase involved in cell wall biosynthesis